MTSEYGETIEGQAMYLIGKLSVRHYIRLSNAIYAMNGVRPTRLVMADVIANDCRQSCVSVEYFLSHILGND